MKELLKTQINQIFGDTLNEASADLIATLTHALILLIICIVIYYIARKVVIDRVHKLAEKTSGKWDDHLVRAHFFRRLVLIIPLLILRYSVDAILKDYDASITYITTLFEVIIAIAFLRIAIAFINAIQTILSESKEYKDKPIQSYTQVVKIFIYFFFGIGIFSVVTGKTPMFFITAMGAMSAILILVFKDSIMGFIGSIQLASNDMVRIGDWITMEKYGADGNVIEINLATIKVRNFDLTITTIPTYALISDSFKNWRGMEESEGRRIKRHIKINTNSVKFCTEEMVERFGSMRLLKSFIKDRTLDIQAHNQKVGVSSTSMIDGRHLTNLGVFRFYIEHYLKEHDHINHDLTCMVRQLNPGPDGIPLEIYAFSKEKSWVRYEEIISDIFDHIIALAPHFELEIFQNPSGRDFKKVLSQ